MVVLVGLGGLAWFGLVWLDCLGWLVGFVVWDGQFVRLVWLVLFVGWFCLLVW